MEAARSLGISLKRFTGWEPVTVVQHEYDDDGRLARSMHTVEAEWDDEQRAWMRAFTQLAADTCSGCGGLLSDVLNPDVEWVADHPLRCHKCEALEIRRDQMREKSRHPGSFTIWPVHERR